MNEHPEIPFWSTATRWACEWPEAGLDGSIADRDCRACVLAVGAAAVSDADTTGYIGHDSSLNGVGWAERWYEVNRVAHNLPALPIKEEA